MKYEKPTCPECGGDAKGTVDTIPYCIALMNRDEETGEYEYDGETKVNWDGQETNRNEAGEVELVCNGYHEWFSKELPEDDQPAEVPNTGMPAGMRGEDD